jgi:hypothetical protein
MTGLLDLIRGSLERRIKIYRQPLDCLLFLLPSMQPSIAAKNG